MARGAAFGDLDDDGDLDVVISLMDARPAILMNESERHPWIRLELLCGRSPRPAIGAAVEVHAGGRVIHRQLKGGVSYHSANDPRLLIGLGAADRVDRVDIRWPDGTRSTLTDPAPNRTHRVVRARGRIAGHDSPRRRGPMTARGRLASGIAAVAATAGLAWAGWVAVRPGPTLDQVVALAQAGRFDEAQALAAEYVRRDPGQTISAHILIAQMALNRPEPPTPPGGRPDPKPALLALEHLDRIRSGPTTAPWRPSSR